MSKQKIILIIISAVVLLSIVIGLGMAGLNNPYEKQIKLAYKFLNDGNYDEAIIAFNKAIDIELKRYEGYLGLYETYIAKEDYTNAFDILEKGIKETNSAKLKDLLENIKEETFETSYEISADELRIGTNNLLVDVIDDKNASITISGVSIEDNFFLEPTEKSEGDAMYRWWIDIYGEKERFAAWTARWPMAGPTQNSLSVYDGEVDRTISDVSMSYTSNSITWNVHIPDEYEFDFNSVDRYKVRINGTNMMPKVSRDYVIKK